MFGLKKQFIKSFIKLEIVSNTPGELKLYIAQISQVEEPFKAYEHYGVTAVKLLLGIRDIKVNYDEATVTIKYNTDRLSAQQIYKWLETLIDITIENLDFIKKYGETDVEYVWNKMEPILIQNLAYFKEQNNL